MKISRNTDDFLILDQRPWVLGLFFSLTMLVLCAFALNSFFAGHTLGGFAFLGAVAFVAMFFLTYVTRTQVVFDRPGNNLHIRTRGMRRSTVITLPLGSVQSAIAERIDLEGDYRVILSLRHPDAEHPLSDISSDEASVRQVVDAINAWLERGMVKE